MSDDLRQSGRELLADIPRVSRCMLPTCERRNLIYPSERGRPPLFCSEAHQTLYRRTRERLNRRIDDLTESLQSIPPRSGQAREVRAALAVIRWNLVRYPRLQP